MLKWVLVLVFGVFTLNVNAQNLIWRKEFADKGKTILKREYQVRANKPQILEGEAITYFSTGSIKSKGSYLKNKPNGFWQFYYENGNLQFEVNYSDAVQNGLYKQYFQNGKLSRSGLFEAGKKTGKWTNFYESEQIQSEGTYIKGIRTEQWIGYYENGKKKYEHFYSNGKSWYIEFYENGSLKMEGKMVAGASDSVWTYYYENGKVKSQGTEKNGVKEGSCTTYFESGCIMGEGIFVKGEPSGNWKYYHEYSGKLASEGRYANGQQDGNWRLFFESGQLQGIGNYQKGTGPYKEYYENGKLKVSGEYKDGLQTGEWLYYDEDGVKEGICNYLEGQGSYEGFYPNGKLKTKGTLQKGKKVGTWSLFDSNGNLTGTFVSFQENATGNPIVHLNAPVIDTIKLDPKPQNSTLTSLRKKRTFYLAAKNNERWWLIGSVNPLALLSNNLPISLEYYIPNRVGLEIIFSLRRKPFAGNFNDPTPNITYTQGYSIGLQHRFYEKDKGYGSVYLAGGAHFADFNHTYVQQGNFPLNDTKTYYYGTEKRIELIGLLGWRVDRNITTTKKITFDFFGGLGFGQRQLILDNRAFFNDLNKNKSYTPFRIGVSFGYLF
jgi:antitoxin component YwqK of YwqJK toxin-antitoxin module